MNSQIVLSDYDVAVVGGGPAGLSAALTASRAGKSVVLFDSGTPRNAASLGAHGFLTRDGAPPAELKAMGRAELDGYGLTDVRDDRVVGITDTPRGHRVVTEGDAVGARAVILAVGLVDQLPDIPGVDRHWGGAIIHCPFCQGWERRGRPWLMLAQTEDDILVAPKMLGWTRHLVVAVGGLERAGALSFDALTTLDIGVDARDVVAIEGTGQAADAADDPACDVVVRFGDGGTLEVGSVVLRPHQRQTALVQSLELKMSAGCRYVWTDEHGETSRRGIYAVGDLTGGHQAVIAAAAAGLVTAQAACHRLTLDALTRGWRPAGQAPSAVGASGPARARFGELRHH